MKPGKDILQELSEIAPALSAVERVNPFSVPEGYFTAFGDGLLHAIAERNPVTLPNIEQSFQVPEGYFQNLSTSILEKVKQQETEPILAFGKENTFTVPEQYFDNLPGIILKKVQAEKTSVVYFRSILKYAVAAAVIGIVSLSVYKYTNSTQSQSQLAAIDPVIEKGKNMSDAQFNATLNNLSEQDIAAYLEANASDQASQVYMNALDPKEIPSEEEYILNDEITTN